MKQPKDTEQLKIRQILSNTNIGLMNTTMNTGREIWFGTLYRYHCQFVKNNLFYLVNFQIGKQDLKRKTTKGIYKNRLV